MKRAVVLALIILAPFVGGAVVGYNIGRGGAPPGKEVTSTSPGTGTEGTVLTAAYEPQNRDSINATVSNSRRNAITDVVRRVNPAVVGINVVEIRQYRQYNPWAEDPFFRHFFNDRTYTERVPQLGSGFLISADGYILTNDHVAGNAKEITVSMTNGEKYPAKLVGTDPVSDIAVLKIDGANLPFIPLGNSDDVITGEWAIAFGNPFGLFNISDKPTVTVGVVSAVGVKLPSSDEHVYRGMIQTDAAINSGNSGGPLVNTVGEAIGMNSVIYTPNQGNIGLGFAIPANRIRKIVAELKQHGKVDRGSWTGLELQPVDRRIARYFGMERVEGVIVSDVRNGSAGERAGFKVGDIILKANGEKIDDQSSLVALLEDVRPGDLVNVRILRERKAMDLSIRVERPAQ